MAIRLDILTLFPEMFGPVLGTSIPKRAAEKGLVSYHLTGLRDFATDAHKSVDDKPFGGGPGMVMMCQTLFDAVENVEKQDPRPATRPGRRCRRLRRQSAGARECAAGWSENHR